MPRAGPHLRLRIGVAPPASTCYNPAMSTPSPLKHENIPGILSQLEARISTIRDSL